MSKINASGFLLNNVDILLKAHPVGEIYISQNNTSPASLFGGTWEQLTADAYFKIVVSGAGSLGGTSSEHKIPISSMPSHSHTFSRPTSGNTWYSSGSKAWWASPMVNDTTASTGDGNAYYPYYYGVYAWRRTD